MGAIRFFKLLPHIDASFAKTVWVCRVKGRILGQPAVLQTKGYCERANWNRAYLCFCKGTHFDKEYRGNYMTFQSPMNAGRDSQRLLRCIVLCSILQNFFLSKFAIRELILSWRRLSGWTGINRVGLLWKRRTLDSILWKFYVHLLGLVLVRQLGAKRLYIPAPDVIHKHGLQTGEKEEAHSSPVR